MIDITNKSKATNIPVTTTEKALPRDILLSTQTQLKARNNDLDEIYINLANAREKGDILAIERFLDKLNNIKVAEEKFKVPKISFREKQPQLSPKQQPTQQQQPSLQPLVQPTQEQKAQPSQQQVLPSQQPLIPPSQQQVPPMQHQPVQTSQQQPTQPNQQVQPIQQLSVQPDEQLAQRQREITAKDILKFQFLTTSKKPAPTERVYKSPREFIAAIEKAASDFGYLIEDYWEGIVCYAFMGSEAFLLNTLLELKTWEQAKQAINSHPESEKSKSVWRNHIRLLSYSNPDIPLKKHLELFRSGINHCDVDDTSAAVYYHQSLPDQYKPRIPIREITSVKDVAIKAFDLEFAFQVEAEAARQEHERPKKRRQFFCELHYYNDTHNTEECDKLKTYIFDNNPLSKKDSHFNQWNKDDSKM